MPFVCVTMSYVSNLLNQSCSITAGFFFWQCNLCEELRRVLDHGEQSDGPTVQQSCFSCESSGKIQALKYLHCNYTPLHYNLHFHSQNTVLFIVTSQMIPFCSLIALGLFRSSSLTLLWSQKPYSGRVNISVFMEITICRCFVVMLGSDSTVNIKNHVYLDYRDYVQLILTLLGYPIPSSSYFPDRRKGFVAPFQQHCLFSWRRTWQYDKWVLFK